jgi:hypothetical protein
MRFDAAKALGTFERLGDPQFAGPDCETRIADFVAEEFGRMGLEVERREVVGSRFPRRVAPWIGWLGYGGLITTAYILVRSDSCLSWVLALVLSCSSFPWLNAVISNWIHPGRHRPPRELVPLVIASLPSTSSAPARVVFQALLGGLEADLAHLLRWTRFGVYCFLSIVPGPMVLMMIITKPAFGADAGRMSARMTNEILSRFAYPGFLAIAWIWILWCLFDEHHRSRRLRVSPRPERYGLALLMEMARTWPRTGSRPIEPVFVAAGGQRLDYAGSREVVRLLGSEWEARPSLLVPFFAPGAGDTVWLGTSDSVASGTQQLGLDAGHSLWIPVASVPPFALLPLWPFEDYHPSIALIGSESRTSTPLPADPKALHRAAQLAAEIALRWAKRQRRPDQAPGSST